MYQIVMTEMKKMKKNSPPWEKNSWISLIFHTQLIDGDDLMNEWAMMMNDDDDVLKNDHLSHDLCFVLICE